MSFSLNVQIIGLIYLGSISLEHFKNVFIFIFSAFKKIKFFENCNNNNKDNFIRFSSLIAIITEKEKDESSKDIEENVDNLFSKSCNIMKINYGTVFKFESETLESQFEFEKIIFKDLKLNITKNYFKFDLVFTLNSNNNCENDKKGGCFIFPDINASINLNVLNSLDKNVKNDLEKYNILFNFPYLKVSLFI